MLNGSTRRSFVCAGAGAGVLTFAQTTTPVRNAFDHLLLGVADLERGIDWLQTRTGVRAAAGGVHPGRGTQNALISLGRPHYLEIIAPDPAQPGVDPQFHVSGLAEPRLINFAVRTRHIEATAVSLRKAGLLPIGPTDGSRRTPSGALLRWKALKVESRFQAGVVNPIPFFIEWASDSVHPSDSAPRGCTIEDLHLEHSRSDELSAALRLMGLAVKVVQSEQVRIVGRLRSPKGPVDLS